MHCDAGRNNRSIRQSKCDPYSELKRPRSNPQPRRSERRSRISGYLIIDSKVSLNDCVGLSRIEQIECRNPPDFSQREFLLQSQVEVVAALILSVSARLEKNRLP